MSILIKGMEMPTDRSRWVVIYPDGNVEYSDKTDEWETLDKGATPVPPHGRLIDANKLRLVLWKRAKEFSNSEYGEGVKCGLADAREYIKIAPTIIEAEEGET